MIDLHSHLLFGIDDGAQDEAETEKMFAAYTAQGVDGIAASSHVSEYNEEYRQIFLRVSELARNFGIQLFPSREYSLPYADENAENLQKIADGKYLLLDTGNFSINLPLCNRLNRLKVSLLLAHPERLWGKSALENALLLSECGDIHFQLNSGSFLGKYGKSAERAAWRLADSGFCSVIASDAHSEYGVNLGECRRKLSSCYSEENIRLWFEINPQRVIASKALLAVKPKLSLKQRLRKLFR